MELADTNLTHTGFLCPCSVQDYFWVIGRTYKFSENTIFKTLYVWYK